MKINKSKIIVPALGLLLLSTAASITGSVAWFTANKTYVMTAGNFAVVNTKDNLQATLTAGIGTTADNANKKITVDETSKVLTDASFDHTALSENTIIAPDAEGKNVNKVIPLADAIAGSEVTDTYGLLREKASADPAKPAVYSAFTWDITFKLNFAGSAAKGVGLYLDLSAGHKTWAHEVVKITGYTPKIHLKTLSEVQQPETITNTKQKPLQNQSLVGTPTQLVMLPLQEIT